MRFWLCSIGMHSFAVPIYRNSMFVINRRPVCVNGTNWAAVDAFSRLSAHRYRLLLTLVHRARIHILPSRGEG